MAAKGAVIIAGVLAAGAAAGAWAMYSETTAQDAPVVPLSGSGTAAVKTAPRAEVARGSSVPEQAGDSAKVEGLAKTYRVTGGLKERLALAKQFGSMRGAGSVATVSDLLQFEQNLFARRALIEGLAGRPEAVDVLSKLLRDDPQQGVRIAAVRALAGREGALSALQNAIMTDVDRTVRLEAVRSLGLIGNGAAKDALVGVAHASQLDILVRQTAIHELRRSIGRPAQPALEALLKDDDQTIRNTARAAITALPKT